MEDIEHLQYSGLTDNKDEMTSLGDYKIGINEPNIDKQSIIESSKIIIATGAKPRQLPNLKVDGKLIWDYRHALTPKKVPEKLIIIGSGAIGIEFASFYNAIGSTVTVIEMQDRILPVEDKEVSDFAKKKFEERGINFHVENGS